MCINDPQPRVAVGEISIITILLIATQMHQDREIFLTAKRSNRIKQSNWIIMPEWVCFHPDPTLPANPSLHFC
jgi:hypothetical protein